MEIERIKIESEILSFFKGNNATVHWDYQYHKNHASRDTVTVLNLITYNPVHGQKFLYHSVEGTDEADCRALMLLYIRAHKDTGLSTWTIEWKYKDSNEKITSYFSGKSLKEAMEKFYFDKDEDTLIVYNTHLNPLS